MLDVLTVSSSLRERDIDFALLLTERKIHFAMHGNGKDVSFLPEDFRRAVSLVNVQIDHRNPPCLPGCAQPLNGHGNVVEDTITRALAAKCMMRPASEFPAPSVRKRLAHGGQRSTY